jgi:catalase
MTNKKYEDLQKNKENGFQKAMTTDQGLRINDDHHSLTGGSHGPTLMEDFILREKITHFDHERIPERVVHARGSAAHGIFKLHTSLSEYTSSRIFTDIGKTVPVFVRFSTVVGSRGSTDLARDVRGFAVKFYTEEGIFDLVGNNIPVFFIQDAMKFPDLVHAIKPEQDQEIPQASSAHDTFWDFISLMPESMHMIIWLMSDRSLPRSYRMMEGFAVHTFRLFKGTKSTFVKFHWKPKLGSHSILWDEAQKISGKDPDFHRRDLWEAIEEGHYPQWELGVQLISETDAERFNLLDPTKLIPEEEIPVTRIGTLTLDRNPDNFFAETEQVAFHPGHIPPGMDFTNDPLLQGRLFSYTDTQLSRLGGPNFHEIPINRSTNTIHNNHREGSMRMQINQGKTAYSPNSMGAGCPHLSRMHEGAFHSYPEELKHEKSRGKDKKFLDHFTQARLFYLSQSKSEQLHITKAFVYELSKCTILKIQERMISNLLRVDQGLAEEVASRLGVIPIPTEVENAAVPADGDPAEYVPINANDHSTISSALSIQKNTVMGIQSRCVAILVATGVSEKRVNAVKKVLVQEGAKCKLVGPHLGSLITEEGGKLQVDLAFCTTAGVLHDAFYFPGGKIEIKELLGIPEAKEFIRDQFYHCKFIGADPELASIFTLLELKLDEGIYTDGNIEAFAKALGKHRYWPREEAN